MTPFITVEGVSFTYPDGTLALDDVSFSIERGETVGVVGQNGAGKTTLAKLLIGLLRPTHGRVTVDGWDTAEHTTAQISRKVGYVFQNPDDQIFHNNVRDEIAFGPKNLGWSDEEVKRAVEDAADLTEIHGFLDENPVNLPYSTRKFVSVASVIAMGGDVVILDEPTAGQDAQGLRIIGKVLERLRERDCTTITITHDMAFVAENFHRTIVMANHRMQQDDDRRTVFWSLPILETARLKQPPMAELAHSVGLEGHVLNADELMDQLEMRRLGNPS